MSKTSITQVVMKVLDAYARRLRSNNPKTDVLRQRKYELRRYGDKGQKLLLRKFVKAAVECFAAGDVREAKRFYNGAFEFGSKNEIRGRMLGGCTNAAAKAFRAGDHEAVWFLLAAGRYYCPKSLKEDFVNELFAKYGVDISQLRTPIQLESLRRMQSIRDLLPVAA